MDGITKVCKAANLLVKSESSFFFGDPTNKRMDLVVKIEDNDILIDATTIDENNPSNGFVRGNDLTSTYFPGATAAALKARAKHKNYRPVLQATEDFVPFVIETQGKWGFQAWEILLSKRQLHIVRYSVLNTTYTT